MPQLLNFSARTQPHTHQLLSEPLNRRGNGEAAGSGELQTSLSWIDRKIQHCGVQKSTISMREKGKKKRTLVKKRPDFCLDSVTSSK